jgi:hypothetical protein
MSPLHFASSRIDQLFGFPGRKPRHFTSCNHPRVIPNKQQGCYAVASAWTCVTGAYGCEQMKVPQFKFKKDMCLAVKGCTMLATLPHPLLSQFTYKRSIRPAVDTHRIQTVHSPLSCSSHNTKPRCPSNSSNNWTILYTMKGSKLSVNRKTCNPFFSYHYNWTAYTTRVQQLTAASWHVVRRPTDD